MEKMRKRGGCFIRDQHSSQPSPWMLQVSPMAGPRGHREPWDNPTVLPTPPGWAFPTVHLPKLPKILMPFTCSLQSVQLLTDALFNEQLTFFLVN